MPLAMNHYGSIHFSNANCWVAAHMCVKIGLPIITDFVSENFSPEANFALPFF